MKRWIALVLLAAGCGPSGAVESEPRFVELFASPDRVSLVGPGAGRQLDVFGRRADGTLEWIDPVELTTAASAVAFVERGRVRATASGTVELSIESGGAATRLHVDVGSASPFVTELVSWERGDAAGFGADRLPEIVLGPPSGGGEFAGSTDVLSLGIGGTITLGFDVIAYDGAGPDLLVFENAFRVARQPRTFAEPAAVALGFGGGAPASLACAAEAWPHAGCAGVQPVLAGLHAPELDPTDPTAAGGDAFELAGVLPFADRVSLTDAGLGAPEAQSSGFDLDAIALVHVLPELPVALEVERTSITLGAGEAALLPRVDALGASGTRSSGLSPRIALDREDVVSVDGALITALRTGTVTITLSAGSLSAGIFLEVLP